MCMIEPLSMKKTIAGDSIRNIDSRLGKNRKRRWPSLIGEDAGSSIVPAGGINPQLL